MTERTEAPTPRSGRFKAMWGRLRRRHGSAPGQPPGADDVRGAAGPAAVAVTPVVVDKGTGSPVVDVLDVSIDDPVDVSFDEAVDRQVDGATPGDPVPVPDTESAAAVGAAFGTAPARTVPRQEQPGDGVRLVTRQQGPLTKSTYLDAIRRDGDSFLHAASRDLGRRVAATPDWTLGDLVGHLGSVHRNISAWVRAGKSGAPTKGVTPPDDGTILDWYAEGLAELLLVLSASQPGDQVWNWSTQPHVASFWYRRAAHETAMHRWDAQLAAHGHPDAFDSRFAADGVDEVLAVHLVADRLETSLPEQAGRVHVRCDDTGDEWLVELLDDGAVDLHRRGGEADATLAGTASDLLLALWGRQPLESERLRVTGDTTLVAALRTA